MMQPTSQRTLRFIMTYVFTAVVLCVVGTVILTANIRRTSITSAPISGAAMDADIRAEIDGAIAEFRGARSCAPPDLNAIFHALRCQAIDVRWRRDPDGCFGFSEDPTAGPAAVDVLLNSEHYLQFGGRNPPILARNGWPTFGYANAADGVPVAEGQAHPNQFLMFLAEIHVSADTSVSALGGERWTVAALVQQAQRSTSVAAGEIAKTIPALAYYVGVDGEWTNKYGETVSCRRLVNALIDEPDRDGYCAGTHYAYAIAVVCDQLQRDGGAPPAEWKNELARLARQAVHSQGEDGSWTAAWRKSERPRAPAPLVDEAERLRVTGHMLEWLCVYSRFEDFDRAILEAAALWICRTVDRRRVIQADGWWLDEPLAHGVHGLVLLRELSG
jgi:hypothetical protein